MTIKLSTAARNFLAAGGSYKDLFQNGRMEIYSGSQPASADAAVMPARPCSTVRRERPFERVEVIPSPPVCVRNRL